MIFSSPKFHQTSVFKYLCHQHFFLTPVSLFPFCSALPWRFGRAGDRGRPWRQNSVGLRFLREQSGADQSSAGSRKRHLRQRRQRRIPAAGSSLEEEMALGEERAFGRVAIRSGKWQLCQASGTWWMVKGEWKWHNAGIKERLGDKVVFRRHWTNEISSVIWIST